MGNSNSHHAYELWTDERNVELVEMLRAGLELAEIAERAGRSTSAVLGQLRKLIPLGYRVRQGGTEEMVRQLLASPAYDWRAPLRARADRANQVYWDQQMNELLRQGWEQARSLQEITETLGASELDVARQLMRLGLAENCRETVERLGCDPAGTLAGRLRLAEDRAGAAVWVLVVDDARGTPRIPVGVGEARRGRRHVSVHLDYDTADLTLDDILRAHTDTGADPGEVTASITERTVGDLAIGASTDPARITTPTPTTGPVRMAGIVDLDEP
ncbi:hypothetical protein ACIRRA_44335 [Nocardia sp. NPDC101769]|uniref:hypothetical protein n=1 Tax=Nocardia sp. NPDC101769 TaxID=3364333 RepID=UPI00382BA48B